VLVVISCRKRPADPRAVDNGAAVITGPDIRCQRCDIKSVALLPNVLGKQRAKEAGAFEAWRLDREGKVGEGTSPNAWIVTSEATVVTRQADSAILDAISRLAVLDIIRREGYSFAKRPFSVAEAKSAREAFLMSTVVDLLPVFRIDGAVVRNQPRPLSQKLREYYLVHAASAK
jgi:D-alanine transaminase